MSTKDTYKPSRNDLLNDLEDIKSSLEQEVFGDLMAEANPKNKQQRELEEALEKEVFGDAEAAQADQQDETDDVPLLTDVTENVVDLSEISLDDDELDEQELTELSDEDAQVEQDIAQILAEEESQPALPDVEKTTRTVELPERNTAPTLDNTSTQAAPSHDGPAKPATQVKAQAALPGQQSLFDDAKIPTAATPKIKPEKKSPAKPVPPPPAKEAPTGNTKTENPFLPAHIRERLNRNHEQSVLQELAQVGDALAKSDTALARGLSGEECALIDALVARYLPEIERELRKQLAEKIAKKPATP